VKSFLCWSQLGPWVLCTWMFIPFLRFGNFANISLINFESLSFCLLLLYIYIVNDSSLWYPMYLMSLLCSISFFFLYSITVYF
jgi:hypothetical protein